MTAVDFQIDFSHILEGYQNSIFRVKKTQLHERIGLKDYMHRIKDYVLSVFKVTLLNRKVHGLIYKFDKKFETLSKRQKMEMSAKFNFATLQTQEVLSKFVRERTKDSIYIKIQKRFIKIALNDMQKANEKYKKITYPNRRNINDLEFVADLKDAYSNMPVR